MSTKSSPNMSLAFSRISGVRIDPDNALNLSVTRLSFSDLTCSRVCFIVLISLSLSILTCEKGVLSSLDEDLKQIPLLDQ
ncbi:hypothetical protein ACHAXS_008829, partial [Conticribra weissflogii]